MAARQGVILKKSPRREPHALGYGTYMLIDQATNGIVAMVHGLPGGYGLSLRPPESVEGRARDVAFPESTCSRKR
jgi:hypothetical protein